MDVEPPRPLGEFHVGPCTRMERGGTVLSLNILDAGRVAGVYPSFWHPWAEYQWAQNLRPHQFVDVFARRRINTASPRCRQSTNPPARSRGRSPRLEVAEHPALAEVTRHDTVGLVVSAQGSGQDRLIHYALICPG